MFQKHSCNMLLEVICFRVHSILTYKYHYFGHTPSHNKLVASMPYFVHRIVLSRWEVGIWCGHLDTLDESSLVSCVCPDGHTNPIYRQCQVINPVNYMHSQLCDWRILSRLWHSNFPIWKSKPWAPEITLYVCTYNWHPPEHV
jgi:hypothetical protein